MSSVQLAHHKTMWKPDEYFPTNQARRACSILSVTENAIESESVSSGTLVLPFVSGLLKKDQLTALYHEETTRTEDKTRKMSEVSI